MTGNFVSLKNMMNVPTELATDCPGVYNKQGSLQRSDGQTCKTAQN
jgi:hypothetical protein